MSLIPASLVQGAPPQMMNRGKKSTRSATRASIRKCFHRPRIGSTPPFSGHGEPCPGSPAESKQPAGAPGGGAATKDEKKTRRRVPFIISFEEPLTVPERGSEEPPVDQPLPCFTSPDGVDSRSASPLASADCCLLVDRATRETGPMSTLNRSRPW